MLLEWLRRSLTTQATKKKNADKGHLGAQHWPGHCDIGLISQLKPWLPSNSYIVRVYSICEVYITQ